MNIRAICVAVCLFFLSACQVELYTGLAEKEGNEMLALLLHEGIDANKVAGKSGTVTINVEEAQLSKAMETLSRHSYPKNKFATINEVFPQGGLIQSSMADNARYGYVKSQDLAATLSKIDGVLTARVHLVIPTDDNKKKLKSSEKLTVTKASVFIKYDSKVPMKTYVPQIKTMVANSVEKLDYKNVAVVIFPSTAKPTVN